MPSDEQDSRFNPLSAEESCVIMGKGTEPAFSGEYRDLKDPGTYVCRRCNAPLYRSEDKFASACGWPSFDDEIDSAVKKVGDRDGFSMRFHPKGAQLPAVIRKFASVGPSVLGSKQRPREKRDSSAINKLGVSSFGCAMPRTARVAPGGTVFHVLNRGVARMQLFEKPADYQAFGRPRDTFGRPRDRHRVPGSVSALGSRTQCLSPRPPRFLAP
jgi:hypothetical protein